MAINRVSQSSIQQAFPKFNTAWDGVSAVGGMDAIGVVVLPPGTSGVTEITFSSIPQTYSHLQLRLFAQTSASGTGFSGYDMYFNSDNTATNYWRHYLIGTGAAVANGGSNASAFGYGNGGNSLSKPYGVTVIDIFDYTNTNKKTTSKAVSVSENNDSTGYVIYNSLLWTNTAAVTTIKITSYYAWTAYSSFALYGIK
jgi:hypothetical protein